MRDKLVSKSGVRPPAAVIGPKIAAECVLWVFSPLRIVKNGGKKKRGRRRSKVRAAPDPPKISIGRAVVPPGMTWANMTERVAGLFLEWVVPLDRPPRAHSGWGKEENSAWKGTSAAAGTVTP